MNDEHITTLVQQAAQLATAERQSVLQQLAAAINHLIETDFERLVAILYRVDVDEQKVKALLRQQPLADAGLLLAGLLLQRQIQKNEYRGSQAQNGHNIPDEEKW